MIAHGNNGKVCVALVIDDFEYGGAQRQVVELANGLNSDRFDVHVCSLSHYMPLATALRDRRRLHVVPKRRGWDATVVVRLAQLLRKLRADIVHGYLFSAEIASRLAGRLAGVPVVIGSQRTAIPSLARRNQLAYRVTSRCADLIIANSRTGAEVHQRLYGHKSCQYRVIYNGVDTDSFSPGDSAAARARLRIGQHEKVVGVFASFKPKKNHQLFFEAAKRMLQRIPSTRLLLVGDRLYGRANSADGYRRRIRELVDKLDIGDRCVFLGNRSDVAHLYSACDVTVLPSLAEGTANVLLESMACAVPVVATDVSDNAYIVPDGQVGYVVPLGRPEAMAERMLLLLEDADLRNRLASKARQWVKREFSTSRLFARTEQTYLECLARRRSQREQA